MRTLERASTRSVLPGDVVVVDEGHGPIRIPIDGRDGQSPAQLLVGARVGQRVRWCSRGGPVLLRVVAIESSSA
jgi:hypothetical protein